MAARPSFSGGCVTGCPFHGGDTDEDGAAFPDLVDGPGHQRNAVSGVTATSYTDPELDTDLVRRMVSEVMITAPKTLLQTSIDGW